ncbi:MAG: hypothetical protein HY814_07020 [Candidatus Riflebacteria bacterium]|nr:hypothetical protein [Candidatus Riflebacteria bacterium]
MSSSTTELGRDLGPSPETQRSAPLRVSTGAEVTLQAKAMDAQFESGSQSGRFSWRQVAGPAVRLAQQDTPPSRSRVTFSSRVPGVYEFECQVLETTAGGIELGPRDTRRLRLIVDEPSSPLPTARPRLHLTGSPNPKTSRQAVAVTVTTSACVPAQTVVRLDGSQSGPGPGGTPLSLRYRWVQTLGPANPLSDPLSVVTPRRSGSRSSYRQQQASV